MKLDEVATALLAFGVRLSEATGGTGLLQYASWVIVLIGNIFGDPNASYEERTNPGGLQTSRNASSLLNF